MSMLKDFAAQTLKSGGKLNILVLCTGNSARSQMAEYLLRKHGGAFIAAYSAGTEPKGVNPLTIEIMREAGLDLTRARSKDLKEYLGTLNVHGLIVVCGDADKKCPAVWPGVIERLYWPFEDPAAAEGTREQRLAKFRHVRDQIDAKVRDWVAELRQA